MFDPPAEMVVQMKDWTTAYSMGLPRILALFAFVPVLNSKIMGGTMNRNGVAAALVLCVLPVIKAGKPEVDLDAWMYFAIVMKETMIGMIIGFCIAIPFWALEACGFFIDNQRGASMASTMNPMSGSETSPMGLLFSQTFNTIFILSGLFLLLLEHLFKSYAMWPVFSFYPSMESSGTLFILTQFDLLITIAMWLAAPVAISMFITEFGVALISRSAPQLNVFVLAMPIKSGVAAAVLVVYVSSLMVLAKGHQTRSLGSIFDQLKVLFQ
ncbi:type III secretion system export apparatus subunit SctT [Endozoicomonadaceae bacterium StTr2]